MLIFFPCLVQINFYGSDYTSISSEDCCAIRASGNVNQLGQSSS